MQAAIIVTFHAPADPAYDFKAFYAKTRERGCILYPGKLTQVETFRVGCIGAIDANEMRNVVTAVAATLDNLGLERPHHLCHALRKSSSQPKASDCRGRSSIANHLHQP